MPAEFVLFNAGGLKGYSYSSRKENPSKEVLLKVLSDARAISLSKMFEYAPIDLEGVKKLAPTLNSFEEAARHFEQLKPSQLESMLSPFVKMPQKSEEELAKAKGNTIDFALSAYVFFALKKFLPTELPNETVSPKELKIAVNYSGWIAIKKCDLAKAQDKEVLATLVGIFSTVSSKLTEFSSTNFELLSSEIEKSLSSYPERRSYARLPAILRESEKISKNCSQYFSEEYQKDADFFVLSKTLKRCGYPCYIVPETINENYPELKIPKPKGNFGGKKKKG